MAGTLAQSQLMLVRSRHQPLRLFGMPDGSISQMLIVVPHLPSCLPIKSHKPIRLAPNGIFTDLSLVCFFFKQVYSPDTFFTISILGPSRPLKENKDSLILKNANNSVVFLLKTNQSKL
ncbi:MAG: hypothetical protein ACLRPQ_07060 [Streptococcus sp.]